MLTSARIVRLGVSVLLAASVFAAESAAHAGAPATPRFAGEHGHATASNTSAVFYNPAALGLARGHRVLLDHTLSLRWVRYDRPAAGPNDVLPGQIPVQDSQRTLTDFGGTNDGTTRGFAPTSLPFVGAHSDFGTEVFALGAAFYVPFDSAMRWHDNAGVRSLTGATAAGARDGIARWHAIDSRMVSRALSLAMAFTIPRVGLSLGATATAMHTRIDHGFARTQTGTDDLVDAAGLPVEGRRRLRAAGWHGSFTVGAVYDVARRGRAWLGLAYTSQPQVRGGMRLRGTFTRSDPALGSTAEDVTFWQTLPDTLRASVRVRPTTRSELRVHADWTRWSTFEHQCVAGADLEHDPCRGLASNPHGGATAEVLEAFPRAWRDTVAVRLGASYWFRPHLEAFLGIGYESRAAPLETLEASLVTTHVIAPSVGVRWQIVEAFALATTWTERIGIPQSTRGRSALNEHPLPLRRPSGDGVYRAFTQLLNVYAELAF